MADGGPTTGPAPPPIHYFCYTCNCETTQINPDFACSTCGSGFIEEIQEGADNPTPPPLVFGGGGGTPVSPGGLGQFFRSISQIPGPGHAHGGGQGGQGSQPAISFDLFDQILNGGGLQQGQGRGQAQSATTSGSAPATPNTSRPRGHFSFVIDSRPRHGGSRDGPGASVTIAGNPAPGGGGHGPNPHPENQMENMLYSFLNDLITGLGGQGGGNVNITGVPVLGNLGDYVWGRDGLDAIVTQLMNQMEGTGPPPMAEEKVKEIPDVKISQEQVDRKIQCSVCWDDFKVDESVKQLECEHLFHPDCILPWLKLHGTCPICRRDFTEGTNPEQQSSQTNPGSTSNPNLTAGNTTSSSSSNPTQGAPTTTSANTANASPLAFLASLVNPNSNPFSLIGNSNPSQTDGSGADNSRNPDGSRRDGNSGSRGTGGGGHLDHMEFDFD